MNRYARHFAGLLLALTGFPLSAAVRGQPTETQVLVLLKNDGRVPPAVLEKAQAEVVRLYSLIGVTVTRIANVPEPGRRFRVVRLLSWEPADYRGSSAPLGLTHVGPTGAPVTNVFWRQVERAAR
jgi:hypothetical protein